MALHAGHSAAATVLLGAVEIVAALLLLLRRTQVFGAGLLLLVFAIATVATLATGAFPARFFYYAATALLIVSLDRKLSIDGVMPPATP